MGAFEVMSIETESNFRHELTPGRSKGPGEQMLVQVGSIVPAVPGICRYGEELPNVRRRA